TVPPKAVAEFYAQGHTPEDLTSRLNENYAVNLNPDADRSSVEILWTIDERFRKFTQELAHRGGVNLTGDDLRQADREHGTRLFCNFTSEEQAAIRAKGKI